MLRPGRALLVALTVCCLAKVCQANDRPYQSVRTAVDEDEEAGTWSIESWVQRLGPTRGLSVEPEYRFNERTSLQVEVTRQLDPGGDDTGHEAEIEFKHLMSSLEKDGIGWGLSLARSGERPASGRLERRTTLKLPISVALDNAKWLLHANTGLIHSSLRGRAWVVAAAAEHAWDEHNHLFAEWAREGDNRYGQIGVRHWLTSERLALDLALQQARVDGMRHAGFIIGLGFYRL